ncbi:hypothetical protein, partial [Nocardia farcinica]|uniref:hypothetical protein n=1 Tax=Nocardia farcinica TaxID=37329 RepID=UPI001E657BAD
VSTGVPSRQRANAGLDQNPVTSSIIFREGAPSRDPQVLIIAPFSVYPTQRQTPQPPHMTTRAIRVAPIMRISELRLVSPG